MAEVDTEGAVMVVVGLARVVEGWEMGKEAVGLAGVVVVEAD